MKDGLISVIVPVYNVEHCLNKCVESIFKQTYQNMEIILVDDGSTDSSSKLCDQFAVADSRFRVIHKPNGGVSSARNAGIDVATGEYITFCDSDDYLEPNYLEMLLETAEGNPDCGHIWCCFQTVTGYQKENAAPNYSALEAVRYYTLQDYMTLHEMWLDTNSWNKLYRTGIIQDKRVRFPEDLSLGEDWLFNIAYIDASENSKIAVITKPLYNYIRGNEASLDSKYRSDLLKIYRRLNDVCLTHLQMWDVSDSQMKKFFDSRFYLYERVLRNTMRAPEKSLREKIHWNTAFLRSAEFGDALHARECFVHPLYLMAYRTRNFKFVIACDQFFKYKNRMCSSKDRSTMRGSKK